MKLSVIFFSLLFFPALSSAAYGERWYNVEVIIFAYSSDMGVQEEHWPLETGVPDISNSVSLVRQDDSGERLPGQVLEFEQLPFKMLSGALRRMQRSSRYDVIYANAWRLPDLP
ncbi:MAG: peptidoglycan binding protein CsiV, partial [Gammaproteobacteria bacterium]|nr:peptidoglycan binding protein CsiV [Gammaproteobacteria bacterium]